MLQVTESRVCQTCKHAQPQGGPGPLALFCANPEVAEKNSQESVTSIFWAVLKFCGEGRTFWEKDGGGK